MGSAEDEGSLSSGELSFRLDDFSSVGKVVVPMSRTVLLEAPARDDTRRPIMCQQFSPSGYSRSCSQQKPTNGPKSNFSIRNCFNEGTESSEIGLYSERDLMSRLFLIG